MHPGGERVTSTESTRRMIQVEIKGRYQHWLEMEPRYEAVALCAVAVRRSRVLLDEEVLIRNPIDSVSRSVVVSIRLLSPIDGTKTVALLLLQVGAESVEDHQLGDEWSLRCGLLVVC